MFPVQLLSVVRSRHGLVPSAPSISVVSPITNPPSFNITLPSGNGNYNDAVAGDILYVAFYTDGALTNLAYGAYSKTLTSTDIASGGVFDPLIVAFNSGTYYPAAWLYRSGEGSSAKVAGAVFSISSLLSGIISYFPLTEGSGTVANDVVSGLDMTLTSAPTWGTGIIGGALSTTSTTQTASNTQSPILGTSALAIAFWAKTTDTVSSHFAVDIGATGGTTSFGRIGCAIENGVLAARFNGGSATGGSGLNNNSWHLCIIEKPVNGTPADFILTADNVTLTKTTSGTTTLNLVDDGTGFYLLHGFLGSISAPTIWNRTLTTSEKTTLWNGGLGKAYPFS